MLLSYMYKWMGLGWIGLGWKSLCGATIRALLCDAKGRHKKTVFFTFSQKILTPPPPPPFLTTSVFSDNYFF